MTLSRLDKLWQSIDTEFDALLITDLLNVRYLSGYTGSFAKILLTREQSYILSDIRYVDQICLECSDFTFVLVEGIWEPYVVNLVESNNLKVIGFEGYALSYNEWELINSSLPGTILTSVGNPVGTLRHIKDDDEITLIKEAARIVDAACGYILDIIKPGMTERQITAEIDCALRKFGANKEGFDTIVVSGSRSALIHGKATDRRVENGDLILMDFGADYQGYNSDITRTIVVGNPDSMQEKIYNIVLDAQLKAIEAIKPGVSGKWIDSIARNYIADMGYGDNFGHGLGHGLGLAVHDGKAFSKASDIILEEGIVATVEPGIYITDWGGIRIEDDILVTKTGCEILTSSPRTLKLR